MQYKNIIKKMVTGLVLIFGLTIFNISINAVESQKENPQDRQNMLNTLNSAYKKAKATGQTVSVHINDSTPIVEKGDLVYIDYNIKTADGKPYATNRKHQSSEKKGEAHESNDVHNTQEAILAGSENELPFMGEAILGMTVNETRHMDIPAVKAFGKRDEKLVVQYPKQQIFPKEIHMVPEEFVKQYKMFPIKDHELTFNPYIKAVVSMIDLKMVTLNLVSRYDQPVKKSYGTISMSDTDQNIVLDVSPQIGAEFPSNGRSGKITSQEKDTITIDFNHPMADVDLVYDIKVHAIIKSARLKETKIDWIENHDQSISNAEASGKPLVMLLYASWCGWCKRLQNETLTDPRVIDLRDQFVWAKINSDQNQEYKAAYEQSGFPMIVILSPQHKVIKRINGFEDAVSLRRDLLKILDGFNEA